MSLPDRPPPKKKPDAEQEYVLDAKPPPLTLGIVSYFLKTFAEMSSDFLLSCMCPQLIVYHLVSSLKVILYSYLILKKMNERITDS